MRKPAFLAVLLLALLVVALPGMAHAQGKKREGKTAFTTFTILASDSLDLVLTEVLRSYAVHSNGTATVVFGAPDELAQGIMAGDPADLVILEDPAVMVELQQNGLLDVSTLATLAGNRLAMAVYAKHRLAKQFPSPVPMKELMEQYHELEMVMADPGTLPQGKAAEEAFTKLGVWDKVVPLLIRAGSARDALYLIGRGQRSGIVYYTDTVNNPEVALLSEVPQELHKPIEYQAAVVAGDNMTRAREFLEFLRSPESTQLFEKYRFSMPEPALRNAK